jgi:hypothetical protein
VWLSPRLEALGDSAAIDAIRHQAEPIKRLGPGDLSTPAPSLAAGGEFLLGFEGVRASILCEDLHPPN